MKLFFKEQWPLLFVQALQLMIFPIIFYLDGYRHFQLIGYALLLSLLLLSCYLIYRYMSQREYYKKLSNPMLNLEESLENTNDTAIAVALDELLRSQFQLYKEELFKAEDKQEEHRLFMDRWVHQMKTPLSVIELTAQSLDEPESSSIREETDRMQNGLEMVLYMARLRTIVEDFQIKKVLLSKLIHEVNQDHKLYYIRNKVYPRLVQKNEGITVETDEKWLFFILTQLIHNAVKYSKGKDNQIVLSLSKRDKKAVLEVKDFGVGIPKSDQKRVFNQFFTGENGREFRESTGMGLYLVKEVADKLGHKVELDSTVGKGTNVRIVFLASS